MIMALVTDNVRSRTRCRSFRGQAPCQSQVLKCTALTRRPQRWPLYGDNAFHFESGPHSAHEPNMPNHSDRAHCCSQRARWYLAIFTCLAACFLPDLIPARQQFPLFTFPCPA